MGHLLSYTGLDSAAFLLLFTLALAAGSNVLTSQLLVTFFAALLLELLGFLHK
jgi:hypothetical protein